MKTTTKPLLVQASLMLLLLHAVPQETRAQFVSCDSVQQVLQKSFHATDSTSVHLVINGDVDILYKEGDSIDLEVRYFQWIRYIGRVGKKEPFALKITESGNHVDVRPADRRSSVLFIGLGSRTEVAYRISLPPHVLLAVELLKNGKVTVRGGEGTMKGLEIITHERGTRIDTHQASFKKFDVIHQSK